MIVVPDLKDEAVISLRRTCAATEPRLRVIPFARADKRSALGAGIRAAR